MNPFLTKCGGAAPVPRTTRPHPRAPLTDKPLQISSLALKVELSSLSVPQSDTVSNKMLSYSRETALQGAL